MKPVDVSKLQYVVFSGKPDENEFNPYYNLVFNFWKKKWAEVFFDLDSEIQISEVDFYRQTRITATIYDQKEVIGINFLTDYKLEDFFYFSYFHDYTFGFYDFLKKEGVQTFQCLQFLLVDPEWSSRKTGLRMGATTLALSLRNQLHHDLDASLTLARDDVPSTSTLLKLGMKAKGIGVKMHNAPVSQLYCSSPTPYYRQEVNELSDFLWNNRLSFIDNNPTTITEDGKNDQFRARV